MIESDYPQGRIGYMGARPRKVKDSDKSACVADRHWRCRCEEEEEEKKLGLHIQAICK